MTESKPTLFVAIAAAAFLAAATTPTDSFASCEGQSADDSYCLDGDYSDTTRMATTWTATNQCVGTMQVEVGLSDPTSGGAQDPKRFTVVWPERKSDTEIATSVSYIRCCDSGTTSLVVDGDTINLCDITEEEYEETDAERLHDAGLAEWDTSDTAQYCEQPTIIGHVNDGGATRCLIEATCTPSGLVDSRTRNVVSALDDVSGLYVCRSGFSHSRCDYNCGDQYCDKQQTVCLSNFEASPAAGTCSDLTASVSGPDPNSCTLRADCPDGDGDVQEATLSDLLASDADNVHNCDGDLALGGCSGTDPEADSSPRPGSGSF